MDFHLESSTFCESVLVLGCVCVKQLGANNKLLRLCWHWLALVTRAVAGDNRVDCKQCWAHSRDEIQVY